MPSSSLLVLSDADVRAALPMSEAIRLMRPAFAALSSGEAEVPVRTPLALNAHGGRALVMPGYLPAAGLLGVKVVATYAGNAAKGLPTARAAMLLLRAEDGYPLALLDAEALSAIRTGAGSGFATDLLARPEAAVCALFGTGPQAETQLEAVCAVRPMTRALVFNRTRAHAEAFAVRMAERLDLPVEVAAEPGRLREADVISTATSASAPLFAAEDVAPGAHINAIGAHRADEAEIPAVLVRRARVVVDHRAAGCVEAGDLLCAGLDVGALAELGEVVQGKAPGRCTKDEVTLFKSVGNAVQDLAVAAHVLAVAEREGLGRQVAL